MTLLSFWVLSSAAVGSLSLRVGRRFESDMKTYAIARSAIPYVQKILEDDETPGHDGFSENIFSSKDMEEPIAVGEGSFIISYEYPNPYTGYTEKIKGVLDEERKLNLNTIDTDILMNLFRNLTQIKPEDLPPLIDAIADWRDEDNDKRLQGAEKFEYLYLKKPYDCKNGPFESLEELLLVKGMTPELLKNVKPYLTVYGSGKVNLNTAPAQVLSALGISDSGISGINSYRLGNDGEPKTEDDAVIVKESAIQAELSIYLVEEDRVKVEKYIKSGLIGVGSDTFSFTSEANLDGYAYPYKLDVIMKRSGQIVSWREE